MHENDFTATKQKKKSFFFFFFSILLKKKISDCALQPLINILGHKKNKRKMLIFSFLFIYLFVCSVGSFWNQFFRGLCIRNLKAQAGHAAKTLKFHFFSDKMTLSHFETKMHYNNATTTWTCDFWETNYYCFNKIHSFKTFFLKFSFALLNSLSSLCRTLIFH